MEIGWRRRLGRSLVRDRRVRYVLVGGVAALVYYAVFAGGWLLSAGRVPYLALAVVANLVSAATTYPLYCRGVFGAGGPWLPGFARFYVTCLWSLVVSFFGLPLLIEVVRLPVLLAQAIVIVALPLVNYQVNRFWAFRAGEG